jgi:hypothetical protein
LQSFWGSATIFQGLGQATEAIMWSHYEKPARLFGMHAQSFFGSMKLNAADFISEARREANSQGEMA